MPVKITPEYLAQSGTEHGHQAALMCWCTDHVGTYSELDLLFAIPNGGLRNRATAARLRAEGVKRGVSDLFLPVARGGYHGLFIEMKKPGAKASEAQVEFGMKVEKQGYKFTVADSWDLAAQIILRYLKNNA